MSYKTILVHADRSRHAEARIRMAAALALAHGAHLVGAAGAGLARFLYADAGMDLSRTLIAAELEVLYTEADQALAAFEAIAASAGVLSYERRLIGDDLAAGLAQQARCADLVVLSQVDRDDPVARRAADLPAYILLGGARPVLLVPYAGAFATLGEHVLVAWDASVEAVRAVAGALALLERAARVSIVQVDPPASEGEQAGADLARYLSQHGVACEVLSRHTEAGTDAAAGEALLSCAADLGADLIVMGGYGHLRVRELLLGGVTATLLATMTVPVLMTH
jgi:nucleotide-binding universal stress UspA family protein